MVYNGKEDIITFSSNLTEISILHTKKLFADITPVLVKEISMIEIPGITASFIFSHVAMPNLHIKKVSHLAKEMLAGYDAESDTLFFGNEGQPRKYGYQCQDFLSIGFDINGEFTAIGFLDAREVFVHLTPMLLEGRSFSYDHDTFSKMFFEWTTHQPSVKKS